MKGGQRQSFSVSNSVPWCRCWPFPALGYETLGLLAASGVFLVAAGGQKSRTPMPAAAPLGQKSRTLAPPAAPGDQKSRTLVLSAAPDGQKSRTLVPPLRADTNHHN